jgi:ubiquinone/menaquinone biosynthesis C-methylase UbiE
MPARRLVTLLVIAGAVVRLPAQAPEQYAADADRLIKALGIRPGMTISEIGAGAGEMTVPLARAVGESGRVYSNELSDRRLKEIASAAERAGLRNVVTVTGREDATGLPDACCDAIVMRDVYHHFANPAAMNVSLLKSLKPGGRLAILDFGPPPGTESANPAQRGEDGQHGVTPPTVERELKAAGFEIVSTTEVAWRSFLLIAQRPTSPRPSATLSSSRSR